MKTLAIGLALLALTGCSAAQMTKLEAFVSNAATVIKTVGNDIVQFDCSNAEIISVIAADADANKKVQKALANNAQIAYDACPALATGTPVAVTSTTVVSAPAAK